MMEDVTPAMITALNACRLHRFVGDIIDSTQVDDNLYQFLDNSLEHSLMAVKSNEGLRGHDELIKGLIEEKKDIQQKLMKRKNDVVNVLMDSATSTVDARSDIVVNDILNENLEKQVFNSGRKDNDMVITSDAEKIEGYLQQEQMLLSSEIAESQSQNTMLMEELLELTSVLNANMTQINETVNEQVPKLEILQNSIVENSIELNKQKESMNKKAEDMNTSWWSLLKLIVYLLVLFFLCVAVIRIF